MLYKSCVLKKDPSIWQTGESLKAISRRTKINYGLLSMLHSGKRVVSEQQYLKYRYKILGY